MARHRRREIVVQPPADRAEIRIWRGDHGECNANHRAADARPHRCRRSAHRYRRSLCQSAPTVDRAGDPARDRLPSLQAGNAYGNRRYRACSWFLRVVAARPVSEDFAFLQVRRGSVDVEVADHPRLVQQRVVVQHRADVAPVPVEVEMARRRRAAAELEDVGGGSKRESARRRSACAPSSARFRSRAASSRSRHRLPETPRPSGPAHARSRGSACRQQRSRLAISPRIFCTKGSALAVSAALWAADRACLRT